MPRRLWPGRRRVRRFGMPRFDLVVFRVESAGGSNPSPAASLPGDAFRPPRLRILKGKDATWIPRGCSTRCRCGACSRSRSQPSSWRLRSVTSSVDSGGGDRMRRRRRRSARSSPPRSDCWHSCWLSRSAWPPRGMMPEGWSCWTRPTRSARRFCGPACCRSRTARNAANC